MKIRLYTINGWHWHGIEFNGQLLLLHRIGLLGECIRP